MVGRPLSFWHNIIFSDESSFAQFSSSGRTWVWRKPNQEFNMNRLQPTVKHGGFSIMVWGAIWSTGRLELVECVNNINAEKYIAILEKGLLPIFSNGLLNKRSTLFMEDGAPCHTARKTQDWQASKGIKKLSWASQSPDTNPIEHVWHILDLPVRRHSRKPASREELLESLRTEWANIPQLKITQLIDSMPNQVKTLKTAKGGATKF